MKFLLCALQALCLSGLLALPAASFAQGNDIEPNNSCAAAQEIGSQSLPYSISGNLVAGSGLTDVDYYRFNAAPNSFLQVDLQGELSGVGSLSNPILGVFDESCGLITYNDDYAGPESRVLFTVPPSGTFVLAASSYPDYAFLGTDIPGTYLLSVSEPETADSISGRLINARTGAPVTGDYPDYAAIQLFRCVESYGCDFISYVNTDSNGEFYINASYFGAPLLTGNYLLQAYANGFEVLTQELTLHSGEALALGDIYLQPLTLVGSISGRVVDAQNGMPLSGYDPPYVSVVLERCEFSTCYPVVYNSPDEAGRFTFLGNLFYLTPGNYRVVAFANDYKATTTSQVTVGEFADVDVGDVPITPYPIQFGDVLYCNIFAGGVCEFGVEVRNRGPKNFKGEGWATVFYQPNAVPYVSTTFQVGKGGALQPMPQHINLKAGKSMDLTFQLDIPKTVPNGSSFCVTAAVGSGRLPQFASQGDRFLFCAGSQSGQLQVLPEKEGRKHFRKMREVLKHDRQMPK